MASVVDVISRGEREGSLFYRVMRWGAHSEEVLDAYGAVKHEKLTVNPGHTVDAAIARIEGVVVREFEKGGTAASIKAALDRVIDQVQSGTGGHRERVKAAVAKVSEKLVRLKDEAGSGNVQSESESGLVEIRAMDESDAAAAAELAGELGYPNEVAKIRRRNGTIGKADLLLVAIDATGHVVGFIQAHRIGIIEVGTRVEIVGLVVSAKARRAGIGRKLIAEVETWAKKVDAEAVVVRSNTKRRKVINSILRWDTGRSRRRRFMKSEPPLT